MVREAGTPSASLGSPRATAPYAAQRPSAPATTPCSRDSPPLSSSTLQRKARVRGESCCRRESRSVPNYLNELLTPRAGRSPPGRGSAPQRPGNPTVVCEFPGVGAKSGPLGAARSQAQAGSTLRHSEGAQLRCTNPEPGGPAAAMPLTGVHGTLRLGITNPRCPRSRLAKAVAQKE